MVVGLLASSLLQGGSQQGGSTLHIHLPESFTLDQVKEVMEFNELIQLKSQAAKLGIGAGLGTAGIIALWKAEESGKVPPFLHLIAQALAGLAESAEAGVNAINKIETIIKAPGNKTKDVTNWLKGLV